MVSGGAALWDQQNVTKHKSIGPCVQSPGVKAQNEGKFELFAVTKTPTWLYNIYYPQYLPNKAR